MSSLAASFGSNRKTKWQGKTVHCLLQLGVKDGDTVIITRLSASASRAQALKVAVDRGNLRANGVVVSPLAIWSHTSPRAVSLKVVGKRAKSIDVWNSWSFDGVDSSWLGSAGMLVESDHDIHTVRCSDGLGDPTFEDLVVTIEIQRG